MSRQKFEGFTLVEILIVVVIMAVLAAVVVPQFTGSTDDAKKSTAEFNLGSMRSVIQTFRAHHEGVRPDFPANADTIAALTSETDITGAVDPDGAFGPYLVAIPENPFTGKNDVKAVATEGTAPVVGDVTGSNGGGWIYDKSTGNIWLDSNVDGEWAW